MNYEPKKPAMNETPNLTNIARSTTAPTNLALNFFDLIARVTCLIDHLVNQIQRAINAMINTTTTISQTVMFLTYSIFRAVISSLDQRLNLLHASCSKCLGGSTSEHFTVRAMNFLFRKRLSKSPHAFGAGVGIIGFPASHKVPICSGK